MIKVLKPASFGMGVRLASTGIGLPDRVVSNADLEAMGSPMNDAEIVKLSGIRTRRWVNADQATSDLATMAARQALASATLPGNELARVVLATVSPDHPSPSAACLVHRALGLPPLPVHDITASCSGFLFALDVATRAVLTGDDHVLAIAADVRSKFLSVKNRSTIALFGDGAGAALLERGRVDQGIVALATTADGSGAYHVYVPAGGSREPIDAKAIEEGRNAIRMDEGPQVYFAAVEGMLAISKALLGNVSLSLHDIDLVVPHQPNQRILDRLRKLMGIGEEKMWSNVARLGNMSGASCAVALHEALASGQLKAGARVLLVAGGAGFTAGAALLVVDDALLNTYTRGAGS